MQHDVKEDSTVISSNTSKGTSSIKVSSNMMTNADCSFKVKVTATDLNIRKGSETNYGKTGKHTGAGGFSIVEVKDGKDSSAGWSMLKSCTGWIAQSYCNRV